MAEIKAKLWIEKDSRFILGAGRAELLRHVKDTGSLVKAAKAMNMSYSHAWSEIRDISEALGSPVIETLRGGSTGGSSKLTKSGEDILSQFEKENEMLDRHLAKRNG